MKLRDIYKNVDFIWFVMCLFVMALMLSSCTVQKQPRILITHVLAVTEKGDTLRLPIDMIKPNVYYKVIHYGSDYWRPYNNHWNYNQGWQNNRPIYAPGSGSSPGNNNNNNNNINTKPDNKPIPDIIVRPTGDVLIKKGGN